MHLRIEQNRAVLAARMSAALARVLPRLEGRRAWLKAGGLSIEPTQHNLSVLSEAFPSLEIERTTQPTAADQEWDYGSSSTTLAYNPRTPPYDHQMAALEKARQCRHFALFMEQGCVDGDTEFLSPDGWKKIKDYQGEMVAQYRLDGTAEFVEPLAYHVKPCEKMAKFKTKYGCDMMLSMDHRMLLEGRIIQRRTNSPDWQEAVSEDKFETTPEKFINRFGHLRDNSVRRSAQVPCSFLMSGEGIDLSDSKIKLQVAFHADGSFGEKSMDRSPSGNRKGSVKIKKQNKKYRLENLLRESGIDFNRKDSQDGFSCYSFVPPVNSKHFVDGFWWNASSRQKILISEEFKFWDGLCSRDKRDIDYMQFCFSSVGKRARVLGRKTMEVSISSEPICLPKPEIVPAPEGKMYCFTVPSTYLVFRRNGCVFASGNTGKTKVAIDRAGELFCAGKITGVLVVAPKGVHRQWADSQIPTHCGVDHEARFWPIKGDLPKELKPGAGLKFLTMNIDGIKTKAGKALTHAFMAAHASKAMMIVDESQTIKSHTSQRWKAANELGKLASHRMILTGTPIAKDLTEEWAQFKWLDESIIGIRYLTAFRNEFCIMGGFEGKQIIGHKNLERFRARVDPYSFRATKDDIGILPKAYDEWAFDLTKDQRRQMQEMKKLFLSQIASGEIATAQNGAVALLRLQQIANGFLSDEEGRLHRLMAPKDNPRIQALKEYLEATEGKVVIWARFREDIKQIAEVLGDECVTYFGSTNDKDRKTAIDSFLSPEGARYFVSNPQAGGVGLNLQGACERAIYYSNSENSIDRWQSEDRIHRIGTSGHVIYTDLIAERSPDRKIINNIKRKKSVSDMALNEIKQIMEDI